MLGAALDGEAGEADAPELLVERLDGLGQIALARLAALRDHARDALVGLGLEVEERKVLQLPLDGAHAQAVGERGVDVHGLARLEQAAVLAQGRQGAHVVQAIRQLDDDDADIAAHGEKHLAQVERLLLVHAVDLDVGELRDAVHELANRLAEDAGHVGKRRLGVLHGVVEQGGADDVAVHLELRQDDGDLDRMVDVELAAPALLVAVLLGGEAVRALGLLAIRLAHVLADELREAVVVVRHDLVGKVIGVSVVHELGGGTERALEVGVLAAAARGIWAGRGVHTGLLGYSERGVMGRLIRESISDAGAASAQSRKSENSRRARSPSR